MRYPDITCTKCSTVVSWRPHCPHCHAYLEFSGIPPWSPQGPDPDWLAQTESPVVAEDSDEEILEVSHTHSHAELDDDLELEPHPRTILPVQTIVFDAEEESDASIEISVADALATERADEWFIPEVVEQVTEELPKRGAFGLWLRGLRRDPDGNFVGYLAALTLAIILTVLFGALIGHGGALLVAPFLLGWGFVSVALFGTIPDQREFEDAQEEAARLAMLEEAERQRLAAIEALRPAVEPEIVEVVDPHDHPEDHDPEELIESRAPQPLIPTIEKSAPIEVNDVEIRDLQCESCERMNIRERRFCEKCGLVLSGATVAPTVTAISAAEALAQEEESRKHKMQMSSSWRSPIFALVIIGVVISALAFAFFGPGAFKFRFGMTRAFQVVNQWIDPYAGKPVTIETVVASSSLPGTDAQELAGADARTFWASAPSPTFGVGTNLTYTLNVATEIDRMIIFPGIQSGEFDTRALASPKDITLTFDDGSQFSATLATVELPDDSRQLVKFPPVTTQQIKLEINSVYPPRGNMVAEVGEVAISGTQFLAVPTPAKFFGFQNGPRTPGIPGVG